MTSKKSNTRLLITTGEPAGIGPDLIIKLLQIQHDYDLTVIGDPKLLEQRAKLLSIPAEIIIVTENDSRDLDDNKNIIKVFRKRVL